MQGDALSLYFALGIGSEDGVKTKGQTNGGDRMTSLANAVSKNPKLGADRRCSHCSQLYHIVLLPRYISAPYVLSSSEWCGGKAPDVSQFLSLIGPSVSLISFV